MGERRYKKGTSNLEIILSFVIFIGFLFFLFMVFPLNKTEKSKVGLDSAEMEIMNFTNINLVYFTIVVNESRISENEKSCFSFEPNITIGRVIVKDENDTIVDAEKIESGGDVEISINSVGRFYQIYSSEEFTERNFEGDCEELGNSFSIGLTREYPVVSYSRVQQLSEIYERDYLSLLRNFSIPSRENFGFSIREINGSEIIRAMRSQPAKSSILARQVPVQIAYPSGELKYGIMNIEVW
jgi:hypothetical protein